MMMPPRGNGRPDFSTPSRAMSRFDPVVVQTIADTGKTNRSTRQTSLRSQGMKTLRLFGFAGNGCVATDRKPFVG